jgi:Calcineurin-like phosphoesterase
MPIVDPRRGDFEDDVSSTKQRTMLALAGSLLAEVSLPKFVFAALLLVIIPGLILGLLPVAVSAWFNLAHGKVSAALLYGVWPVVLLALIAAIGWLGGRRLLRAAETSFWSLNAIVVQPIYAICREVWRHLLEHMLIGAAPRRRGPLRAITSFASGLFVCVLAIGVAALAWPWTHWTVEIANVDAVHQLVLFALANSVVIVSAYLAGAAIVWSIADGTMAQPADLEAFEPDAASGRVFRIAHLSDLHVVGTRWGYRIECGRSGPRGNERLAQALARLDAIHEAAPLDAVLVTGDVTDAGLASEWAEFFEAMRPFPRLAERLLILPGNHDINVVDRTNPARLELPTSPAKRLRYVRMLSALEAVQGGRVHIADEAGRIGPTLSGALAPHRDALAAFADGRARRITGAAAQVWDSSFPLVVPPPPGGGLGIMLLNSNAETHFSFTNALGFLGAEQTARVMAVAGAHPNAAWIIALHHHLVEYPKPAKALSERIGTTLINGTWFVRRFRKEAGRIVVMHGHRHIDWIGMCGDMAIVSAPSPVMEGPNDTPSYFYVHRIAARPDGSVRLLAPERVQLDGVPANCARAMPGPQPGSAEDRSPRKSVDAL